MRSPTATATWLWPKSTPADQPGVAGQPDGGAAAPAARVGLDQPGRGELAHDVGHGRRGEPGGPGQLGLGERRLGARSRRAASRAARRGPVAGSPCAARRSTRGPGRPWRGRMGELCTHRTRCGQEVTNNSSMISGSDQFCVHVLTTTCDGRHSTQIPGSRAAAPSRGELRVHTTAPPGSPRCCPHDRHRAASPPAAPTTPAAATAVRQRRQRRRQDHRAAAARVQDHPLRDLRQAAVRGQGQGALLRLHRRLLQRRPGRGQAEPAGRHRDQRGRQGHRARPGQRRRCRRHGHQRAQDQDVPVIAYDRFIEGVDYYMSFDNETVGKMQAEALVSTTMGDKGNILMLNGAPSDPNAAQFKAGAHSVLDEQRREDPRGVRQPRLEPGERPAVRHRPAEQVRPLRDPGRLRRQRRPGRRRGRGADRRRRRRPTRCPRSRVRTPSSPRSSASSPGSRR